MIKFMDLLKESLEELARVAGTGAKYKLTEKGKKTLEHYIKDKTLFANADPEYIKILQWLEEAELENSSDTQVSNYASLNQLNPPNVQYKFKSLESSGFITKDQYVPVGGNKSDGESEEKNLKLPPPTYFTDKDGKREKYYVLNSIDRGDLSKYGKISPDNPNIDRFFKEENGNLYINVNGVIILSQLSGIIRTAKDLTQDQQFFALLPQFLINKMKQDLGLIRSGDNISKGGPVKDKEKTPVAAPMNVFKANYMNNKRS